MGDDKAALASEMCEATEGEIKFLRMTLRYLKAHRQGKANGDLNFKAMIRDGGIFDRYVETKLRDSAR